MNRLLIYIIGIFVLISIFVVFKGNFCIGDRCSVDLKSGEIFEKFEYCSFCDVNSDVMFVKDISNFDNCDTSEYSDEKSRDCILEMINKIRQRYELNSYAMDNLANDVAARNSEIMIETGVIAHIDGYGVRPPQRAVSGGIKFEHMEENIAVISAGKCSEKVIVGDFEYDDRTPYNNFEVSSCVMSGLIKSELHYLNLVNPYFKYIGVGVRENNNDYYVTMDFFS